MRPDQLALLAFAGRDQRVVADDQRDKVGTPVADDGVEVVLRADVDDLELADDVVVDLGDRHEPLSADDDESSRLEFGDGVRGCRLSYYGDNELPDAVFSWDRCALFDYQPDDLDVLARLVSRWICDAAMPSAIREECPWLEVGDVADAYEQGRGIEGEFVASWDSVQEFFAKLPFDFAPRTVPFLAAMRSHGFDRTLRAGQSMATLILSRSRRHGLVAGAPYLAFVFSDVGVAAELSGVDSGRRATNAALELNDAILELLRALEAEPIR